MEGTTASGLDSWPAPNYINPETRGPAGKIVEIVFISLVTVILLLRLYSRQFISKGLGLDDLFILLSYIPATAFAVLAIYGETYLQWNRHVWDIDPSLYAPSLKASIAELILFDFSTSATKLSMLAMIYRLTSKSEDRRMNFVVIGLAVVIGLNAFTFLVVTIFQCSPIYAYWTPMTGPRHCINEAAHLIAASTINTLTDFLIVFLPMRTVAGLGLPKKQRYIVMGLFGIGLIACAAGVIRTVFTVLMTTATNEDKTWNAWAVWLASGIELYLGIICASIPAIKPFFGTYLPQVIDTTLRSRKSSRFSKDQQPMKAVDEPWVDMTSSQTSFQTFIYGGSTPSPKIHIQRPRPAMMEAGAAPGHEKSSSADLDRPTLKPPVGHKRSISAELLNKPLPTIRPSQYFRLDTPVSTGGFSDRLSATAAPEKTFSPQRNGMRFTNPGSILSQSSAGGDRTTVFIMLGDEVRYGQAI